MLSNVQQFTCPCCRGYIGRSVPLEYLPDGDFTPQQRDIIGVLSKHVGAWVTNSEIENALWASLGGKTHNPSNKSVNVQLTHLRRKVKAYGWHLATDRRGKHKLSPSEVGP